MRLVYLSPVAWGFHAHRPHKFVEWFHRETGGEVLWVNPYPTRLPSRQDWRHLRRVASPLSSEKPAWVTILHPKALPIEPLEGVCWINRLLWGKITRTVGGFAGGGSCMLGIGKPSDLALHLMDRIRVKKSFFDAMDDFPEFYLGISRKSLLKRELVIASRVTKLLVSSTALLKRWARYRNDAVLALNGCDVAALPPAGAREGGSDVDVLGYIGTIGDWFDWEIVFRLAQTKPSTNIWLIGPVVAPLPKLIPKNISLLGPFRNDAAIAAMGKFRIGLIPFKQNRLTASVDPIKYYEYRAMGLPVISTCFGEMALRKADPGVLLIDDRTDLQAVVDAAKAYRMIPSEIERFRAEHSWHARFSAAEILS